MLLLYYGARARLLLNSKLVELVCVLVCSPQKVHAAACDLARLLLSHYVLIPFELPFLFPGLPLEKKSYILHKSKSERTWLEACYFCHADIATVEQLQLELTDMQKAHTCSHTHIHAHTFLS